MVLKKFIIKFLLFTFPLQLLLLLYFYIDPFMVLRHYDKYYVPGIPSYVTTNRDYISTQNWLNYYPVYHYDSYIFGSSRTRYYDVTTWKKYINRSFDQCYHFDASGESLYGIEKKFRFLDNEQAPIANAIIMLDHELLSETKNDVSHIKIKHPILSGQSAISYQLEFIKAFFDHKFIFAYLDFLISGKVKNYMKEGLLLNDIPNDYNHITNELRCSVFEKMIIRNAEDYYGPRKEIFYKRDSIGVVSPVIIAQEQKSMLLYIAATLKNKHTNYKIIINPLYDQKIINPVDLQYLYDVFGKENVFNFSGINEFTRTYTNYYETSHYRPKVADEIMSIVYK